MTEKRFVEIDDGLDFSIKDFESGEMFYDCDSVVDILDEFDKENKELKEELRIYRQVANCHNCTYHDYDWYDDGDEFEVCRKGNNVSEGICKDWEEL